jgi:hypothetical protein
VYHKNSEDDETRQPLLLPGLWTRVKTGLDNCPELDSFTLLTTESCPQIAWLHHRMPVCIWDMDLAKQWLNAPTEALKNRIDDAARSNPTGFAWHKVAPEMSKLTFRGKEAIQEVKETTQSVANFFSKSGNAKSDPPQSEASKSVVTKSLGKDDNVKKETGSTKVNIAVAERKQDPSDFRKRRSAAARGSNTTTKSPSSKKLKTTSASKSPAGDNKQKSITSFFTPKS